MNKLKSKYFRRKIVGLTRKIMSLKSSSSCSDISIDEIQSREEPGKLTIDLVRAAKKNLFKIFLEKDF